MSLFELCGIEEGEMQSEEVPLSFSLATLNKFMVLYRKESVEGMEKELICENEEWKSMQSSVLKMAVDVLYGNYGSLFESEAFKVILTADRSLNESVFVPEGGFVGMQAFLKQRVLSHIHSADTKTEESLKQQEILLVAITLLTMYMQANYTGPELREVYADIDSVYPFTWFRTACSEEMNMHEMELRTLEIDGETPYELEKVPLCLSIAEALLNVLRTLPEGDLVEDLEMYVQWWQTRSAVAHHRCLLSNPSPTLTECVHSNLNMIEKRLEKESVESDPWEMIRCLTEHGLFYLYSFETEKANPYFLRAMKWSQLDCEVTGVKGRRTKYQTFDTSQLVVYAESKMDENQITTATDTSNIPSLIKLDEVDSDNILLENILMAPDTNSRLRSLSKLSVMDQILIQCLCIDIKNNNPKYGLITEQMSSYIQRVLAHPSNWTVYSYSLLLKSYVDYENSRTKERAILQLQVLVDQLSNETTPLLSHKEENEKNAPVWERMMYLYSTGYPPFWEMKKRLAEHYFAHGIIATALNIYKELELFEDIVNCLEILGKKDEAMNMLEEKLRVKGPTPYLLCRLGELKKNPHFMEQAWELSNHRYARAQRDLGDYYYEKGEFAECKQHYALALEINMLYPNTWFKNAVAAMHVGDYAHSISCFTTLLKLNEEFGEGWSNLAGVLMKVGKYDQAFEAATQSVRYLRENWRVWDNYITISMMAKKYARVIEGLTTLLNIKDKNEMDLDYTLLSNLTYTILNEKTLKDAPDTPTPEGEEGEEGKGHEPEGQTVAEVEAEAAKPLVKKPVAAMVSEDLYDRLNAMLGNLEKEHVVNDVLEEETEEELQKKAEEAMGSENDRQFLIRKLTDLFDKLQKMFPRDVKLYNVLYYFYSTTNQMEQAFDAMLKKCRSHMAGNYLASEQTAQQVLTTSLELLKFVVEKEHTKKLFEVKMLCRSIVSRCTRSYSGLPEYQELKVYLEEHAK